MPAHVLVTGSSGYLARHLIPELRRSLPGVRLTGIAADSGSGAALEDTRVLDLRDPEAVRATVEQVRPDAVVHLAARRDADLRELLEHNAVATDHLLAALRGVGSAPVVIAGSAAEIGHVEPDENPLAENAPCRPIDAYGISKLAQSAVAHAAFLQHRQPIVRVRIFNLLGPGLPPTLLPGRCLALLAAARESGEPLRFRDLGARRDYVDVRDAARALVLALERGTPGGLYHIGSGQARSGREVVEALIAAACGRGGVRYEESLPSPLTVALQVSDPARAARELGWTAAIPFDQSIGEMWQDRATR